MSNIDEVKNIIKEGKAIIGTKEVIKGLKLGKIDKAFLTNNCPDNIKEDIMHYAKLSDADVSELEESNKELGVICKKPFSISVLGKIKGA